MGGVGDHITDLAIVLEEMKRRGKVFRWQDKGGWHQVCNLKFAVRQSYTLQEKVQNIILVQMKDGRGGDGEKK